MSSNTEKNKLSAPKRPYETPRIEESAKFETLAAGCGFGVGGGFGCEVAGTPLNS
jgi:hypothetical protein